MSEIHGMKEMIGSYYLVALDSEYNGLYCFPNMRMGGRSYKIRFVDGKEKSWSKSSARGTSVPKAPPRGGRWKWLKDEFGEKIVP